MAVSTGRIAAERDNLLSGIKNEDIILIYDLETTGLNKDTDRIAQLCIRTCLVAGADGLQEIANKTWYLNPGFPMPEPALKVHGLSDEFLKDKPKEADVFAEIRDYMGDYPVCGYNNKGFDDLFMQAMYKRCGGKFSPRTSVDVYPAVCTVLDASQVKNHKLGTVASYWGFDAEIERFHNAEGDTLATRLILAKLIEVLNEEISPKYAGALKVDVTQVAYWKGAGNVRPRIYVTGKVGETDVKFWINPLNGSYQNADKSDPDMNKYDVDDLEKKVLDRIKCDYKSFTGKV